MAEKQNAPETEKKKSSFFGGDPEEKAKMKAEKAKLKEEAKAKKAAEKAEKAKLKEEAKAEKAKAKEEARAQKIAAKEAKAKEKNNAKAEKPAKEKKPSMREKRAANKALIAQYQAQNKPTMMKVNYVPPTGNEATFESKAHVGGPSCYSCCGPKCAITFVGIVLVLIVCCAYVSPKDQPCCSICYWPF